MRSACVSTRFIVVLTCTLILCLSPFAGAQTPAPAAAPTLDRLMSQINRQYRMVKAQVADKAQNAKTLEALTAMESAVVTAKGMVPASVAKLPEADRPAKTTEYRKMMANLLGALVEMETNLLADDNTKAAAMVAKIDDIQKQGHTAFRVDE
jgi:hypothetical protein